MAKVIGAKLVANALVEKGIEKIFTLSGGHITPIYQHLADTDIEMFDTRHEQSAVFMAEAYGRLTRKPGVAMVTAGPGFTNALTPVANARQANSPLLLISGVVGVASYEKLDLQDMTQAPIIEPMVKKAIVCHSADRIPEFIDMAYRICITGRPGPVYLELPVDILNEEVEENSAAVTNTAVEDFHPVDLAKARQLVGMLKEAKCPTIMAGNGTWYSHAEKELVEFAEKAGVPIYTQGLGRGCISDDHPLCYESSTGTRPGSAMVAQAMSDLVIFLGNRLSLFYMFGALINPQAKIVQVDIEPEELGRNRTLDLAIFSDIKALLQEMTKIVEEEKLGDELKANYAPWIEQLDAAQVMGKSIEQPNWDSENVPVHPLRLAKEVNEFMNREDDIVIADGGDTQIWVGMTRTMKKPGTFLDSGLYGCLGVGIPYANAAQVANPDSRVCLVIGDGAFGFNFMEIETALRKKLPIVIVIANDQGWGMIRHSQELRMGEAIPNGTWIGDVRYEKAADALGVTGYYLENADDLKATMEKAFATGKPAVINVMTDTTTVSPGSIALANVGAYK